MNTNWTQRSGGGGEGGRRGGRKGREDYEVGRQIWWKGQEAVEEKDILDMN